MQPSDDIAGPKQMTPKVMRSGTAQSSLPFDVVVEILCEVPLKITLRLQAVERLDLRSSLYKQACPKLYFTPNQLAATK